MSFTCRTLPPFDAHSSSFVTLTGVRMWLGGVYGYDVSYTELSEVHTWMKGANVGDVAYMDDSFRLVSQDKGDIEMCCNDIVM